MMTERQRGRGVRVRGATERKERGEKGRKERGERERRRERGGGATQLP